MERLYSTCTRLHDLLESRGRVGNRWWLEELNLDVSTEELLSPERAFTYADLYAILGNEDTLGWLTPYAAVARARSRTLSYWEVLDRPCRFSFDADGKEINAFARSPEHLSDICDVVLRLLAASVVHSVLLREGFSSSRLPNAPSLAYLMEQCQSLKVLTLQYLEMDENHLRVLGTY
jgi:hypothetical protein